MSAGRPPKFENIEELQNMIDGYFEECQPEIEKDSEGNILTTSKGNPIIKWNPPTLTGLALKLGFVSRQSIYDYEKRNDEFSYTIKKARLQCENWVEKGLLSGTIPPASAIFTLKNYGWRDTQDIKLGGDEDFPINITINGIKSTDKCTRKVTPNISDET